MLRHFKNNGSVVWIPYEISFETLPWKKSKYRPVGNKHKQADEAYKVWSTICLTVSRLKPVISVTATGIQSRIPQAITDRKSAAHSLCRSQSAAQQKEKCLSKPCRELKQTFSGRGFTVSRPTCPLWERVATRAALMSCWFRYLTNRNDFGY